VLVHVTWLIHVWRDSFQRVPWLSLSVTWFTGEAVFIHVTWLLHMWRDSFQRVTWLILVCDMVYRWSGVHTCDMTHSCMTWLISTCDMTHFKVWHDLQVKRCSYMWHDSFMCNDPFIRGMIHFNVWHGLQVKRCSYTMTWLTNVWHDSFQRVTWLIRRATWLILTWLILTWLILTWLIYLTHFNMTHFNMTHFNV